MTSSPKKILFRELFKNTPISLTSQLILMEKHLILYKLFGAEVNKILVRMNINPSMNLFQTLNLIININYIITPIVL